MGAAVQPELDSARARALRLGFLIALILGSFGARLARLMQSVRPPGTDGYYYVVQVEHVLRFGSLHVPDGSWVLWLLAGVSALCGDPILGVKVGSALLAACLVPAAWQLGRALAKQNGQPGGGLQPALLAVWAASSPALMHLAGDFPKNLGMAAPLLVAWASAISRPSRRSLIAGAAAALLAATAHRVGAAWVALSLVGLMFGLVARAGSGRLERRALAVMLTGGALLLAFAMISSRLPNLLHPLDWSRVSEQLSFHAQWPPPVSFFDRASLSWPERIELLLVWPALIAAGARWWRWPEQRPAVAMLVLPCMACVLPVWRTDQLDLGYRLSLVAPIAAVPLLARVVPQGWPRAAMRLRGAGMLAIAGAVVTGAWQGFDPHPTPPYARYERVLARIPEPLPDLLIAPPGMSFLYVHRTGREAMAWAPEPGLDRSRIGRVVFGIRPGEWMELGAMSAVPLDADYSYVREDVWEAFVEKARTLDDEDLQARIDDERNPSQVRPPSLLRNHH